MNSIADMLPDAARRRAAHRARRERLRVGWEEDEGLDAGIVVVPSGLSIPVDGSDQSYGFRGHDDHAWLAGCRIPGQVLVYDAGEGVWTLFAYRASAEDRVWHGGGESLEALGERLGIPRVRPASELGPWVASREGRQAALLGSRDILEVPIGYALRPGDLDGLEFDADLTERLQTSLEAARRRKDDLELDLMRAAAEASLIGHLHLLASARTGWTERALQIEIDYAFERAGADRPAYPTIAVTGANCAVLHATPGARQVAEGDLVLVDAGAEVDGYDCDVTRTWPASGAFVGLQRDIYQIVLDVQEQAIRGARKGAEFRKLHLAACVGIARGLVDLGLLRGDPEGLVERDAHALFFPHGLGHLVGLATHDVGGWEPGRERSERPGLKFLRIDTPLAWHDVVTMEPGIYFVKPLLQDPELRREHHDAVAWDKVDAMMDFGGVRIEDDVLVTDGDPEVLTAAIPKTVEALEALR